MKTILLIPVPEDGNSIFVTGIKDNIITYRRAFNPKHKIEEDFIIKDNMICTVLIHFPAQWLNKLNT